MDKCQLVFEPVKMTPEVMECLEAKGLIERLAPSRDKHRIPVHGEGLGNQIYASDVKYGGHKLISVAIDNERFSSFATHPDNEEFILLGGINERPMYLLVCFLDRETLLSKINDETLRAEDFILLDCVFNDPYVSFFVMKAGVPHGECAYGSGRPATFYVTEGENLPLDKINLYEHYDVQVPMCK